MTSNDIICRDYLPGLVDVGWSHWSCHFLRSGMVEALQCGSILSIAPYFSHLGIVEVFTSPVSRGGIHGYPRYFDDIPVFNWLSTITYPHLSPILRILRPSWSLIRRVTEYWDITKGRFGEVGCTVTIRGWWPHFYGTPVDLLENQPRHRSMISSFVVEVLFLTFHSCI